MGRAERLAPWVCGALFALPVLISKYPPMDDLPLHEACVGLLRHWGDAVFAPPTLYRVNIGQANELFSFLVFALSFAMPIGWASKLAVASLLFALPLATAHFADHLRSSRWTTLLVAPVGLGFLFFWGLVQNILGLVVLLWLLPSIDRFTIRPSRRGAAAMCGAIVLLHFAHQAMQLAACAAIVACSIGTNLREKPLLRAAPIGFCLALAFAANRLAWRMSGPVPAHTQAFLFHEFGHKLTVIPGVLFGGYEPTIRDLLMLLALIAVGLVASAPRTHAASGSGLRSRVHAWRFEILVIFLAAVYFSAPAGVHSTALVYHRFLPPAWAVLAVCAGARRSIVRPLTRVACATVPLATLLVAWPAFAESDRAYTDLEPLIDQVEIGSSVVALNLGPQSLHRLWDPSVAQGHIVAIRGGRSLNDYTWSPNSPVMQRAERQWPSAVAELTIRPYLFRPAWHFTRFRYLLVWTSKPDLAAMVTLAFASDARLVGQRGDWYLFESTLKQVPIDAPDAPVPRPAPPSLGKILSGFAREIRDTDPSSEEPRTDGPADP